MTVLSDPTLLDRFIYAITLYWTDLFMRSHSTGQIYLSDPTLLDRFIYAIPLYWTDLFMRSHSTGQIYLCDSTGTTMRPRSSSSLDLCTRMREANLLSYTFLFSNKRS